MRVRTMLAAASLFAFVLVGLPGAEAAPEPVGSCSSGATVEVCIVNCIQPPCPNYVCINSGAQRLCRPV